MPFTKLSYVVAGLLSVYLMLGSALHIVDHEAVSVPPIEATR